MTADLHGKPGHNSGDDVFGLAIEAFVGNARIEEALLREEIGKFPDWERLLLVKNGMALGLVRLCRAQPRMDCAPVLYSLVCLLSDNDRGFCWLSQRRFAELLARSPTTVSEAFGRLLKVQAIDMAAGNGEHNACWPMIPKAIVEAPGGIMWMVDRLSTPSQQARAVMPGQSLSERLHKRRESARTLPVERDNPSRGGEGLVAEPFPSSPQNPSAVREPILTNDSTPSSTHAQRADQRAVVILKSEVASEAWMPREDQYVTFHQQYHSFGRKPSPLDINPHAAVDRRLTDQDLNNLIRPHKHVCGTLLERALDEALGVTGSKIAGDAHEGAPRAPVKFGQFTNYLRKVFGPLVDKYRLAEHELVTKAATATEVAKIKVQKETEIAGQQLKAHAAAIESNAAVRLAKGSSAPSHQDPDRFSPRDRFDGIVGYNAPKATGEHANEILDEVPGATKADVRNAWLVVSEWASATKSASQMGRYGIIKTGSDEDCKNLGEVVRRWRATVWKIAKHRDAGGSPEKLYGEPLQISVSSCGKLPLTTSWVVLTKEFVTKVWSECPELGRCHSGYIDKPVVAGSTEYTNKILAWWRNHRVDDEDFDNLRDYGQGLQERFEAAILADAHKEQAANSAEITRQEEAKAQRLAEDAARIEAERKQKEDLDEFNRREYGETDPKLIAWVKRRRAEAKRDAEIWAAHNASKTVIPSVNNQALVNTGVLDMDPADADPSISLGESLAKIREKAVLARPGSVEA